MKQLSNTSSVKHRRLSRAYVEGPGLQGLARRVLHVVGGHLDDWDIVNCMFTLLAQIITRLRIELDHPAANFVGFQRCSADRGGVLQELGSGGKEICLGVINGSSIPEGHEHRQVLKQLRTEGRLLRWASATVDREFHTKVVETPEVDWPEATTFFYLWTGAEAWVAEALSTAVRAAQPLHHSLHFDGFMLDKTSSSRRPDLIRECEEAVVRDTKYKVKLVKKHKS